MTPHQKLGREGVNRTLVVGTKIQRPAIERPRAGAPGRTRTPVVPGRNGMHKSALPQAHFDSGARCWSRTNLTGLIRAVPHRWVKRAKPISIVAQALRLRRRDSSGCFPRNWYQVQASVEMSLDAARTSACATSEQI